MAQQASAKYLDLNVRTSVPPETLIEPVRAAIAAVDPRVALFNLRSQEGQIDEALVAERVLASLASGFAIVAVAIMTLGLVGVLSLFVVARRREIGIRLALGASPADASASVVRPAVPWIAGGLVIGTLLSAGLAFSVRALLFGVRPVDPASFGAAGLVIVFICAVGIAVPAKRAAAVDPLAVLRDS